MTFTLKKNPKYPLAFSIAETLKNAGHEVLFAGGCVRDSLLGKSFDDIDIATSATPEEIKQLFRKTLGIGAQFGVIMVIEKGTPFEVATFRKDENYIDGRRPESVTYSHPREDAFRRDFTVNGLFWDPFEEKILDFVGGMEDLEKGLIRTIGNPMDRFGEDKLRLLRAIRFSARLGFEIEAATLKAVRKMGPQIKVVSRERIRDEVFKTLKTGSHSHLLLMDETRLWQPVFGFPFRRDNVMLYKILPPGLPVEILFFSLFWQENEETIEGICTDFRLSNREKKNILNLKFLLQEFPEVLSRRLSAIKRLCRLEIFEDLLRFLKKWEEYYFTRNPGNAENLENIYLSHRDYLYPAKMITGEDLKVIGLEPSPLFREILEEIENLQMDGKIKTREEALKKAKELKETHEIQHH